MSYSGYRMRLFPSQLMENNKLSSCWLSLFCEVSKLGNVLILIFSFFKSLYQSVSQLYTHCYMFWFFQQEKRITKSIRENPIGSVCRSYKSTNIIWICKTKLIKIYRIKSQSKFHFLFHIFFMINTPISLKLFVYRFFYLIK